MKKNNSKIRRILRNLKPEPTKKNKSKSFYFEDDLFTTMTSLGVPMHPCGGVYIGDGVFLGPDGEFFEE